MIKVFLDTNILFPDNRKIFNKLEFGGEYKRIIKKLKKLNKFSTLVKIYIPEIAILEFKNNCIEEFCKQRKTIDSFNEDLKNIFGDNLTHTTTLSWNNIDEYNKHLDKEIDAYIKENLDNFSVIKTPDCFKKIIERAVSKKPLFKEARSGTKTYYDAGFKDNLILETCLDNLSEHEIGILYTKDNDFFFEQNNLCIVKSFDEFEAKVKELCPDYAMYDILDELENKKIDILSFLGCDYGASLIILGFTKEICEYDEEDDIIRFVVVVSINDEEKQLIIVYDIHMKEILDVTEK